MISDERVSSALLTVKGNEGDKRKEIEEEVGVSASHSPYET